MAGRLSDHPRSAAPTGAAEPGAVPALALSAVTKRFDAQTALDGVDLELRGGEVHALLGENGSGKSTLIKVLAGFHQPDGPAAASVHGEPLQLGSAVAARAARIHFVHQDLALVGDLDVAENLALGQGYAGRAWLSDARERRAAQELLDGLEIEVDAHRLVRDLTPVQRTLVAVARALRDGVDGARILVLDEVTAALPESEVQMVFGLVRRIRDRGGAVLYVTHRLEEVLALADRVTVLRDGRRVTTTDVAGLDHDQLVELIVGRPAGELYPHPPKPEAEEVLRLEGLGGELARDVDLALHRGEIVGVAGLVGSGREELPYLIFGAQPWSGGELVLGGRRHARMSPPTAIRGGLGLIPAERATRGSMPSLSLRENVTLPRLRAGRLGWIDQGGERRDVAGWLERLRVDPPLPDAPLTILSGGNQQKVVLARWLRCDPAVLLLDEPTQGVDVGSKAAIYQQLADRAGEGLSILMASTDHEELAAVCDRVVVMRAGRAAFELAGDALTPEAISERVLAARPDENPESRS